MDSCVNCHHPLGVADGEIPFTVTPADGEGDHEMWCAQCFVWKRAPMEPERFPSPDGVRVHAGFRAVHCTNPGCQVNSVDPGIGRCLQCNCTHLIQLPPRPATV